MPNMLINKIVDNVEIKKKNDYISTLQFYSYKFSIRDNFNRFLNLGKLSHQFIINSWLKIESCKLYFLKNKEDKLRTDLYTGLMDYLKNKKNQDGKSSKVGKMVILPTTHVGSPRALHQNFLDAMTLVQKFGKPDFFITFTCNPQNEILKNLNSNETPLDRPDIISRVFQQKSKEFIKDITKNHVLTFCKAHTLLNFKKEVFHIYICWFF